MLSLSLSPALRGFLFTWMSRILRKTPAKGAFLPLNCRSPCRSDGRESRRFCPHLEARPSLQTRPYRSTYCPSGPPTVLPPPIALCINSRFKFWVLFLIWKGCILHRRMEGWLLRFSFLLWRRQRYLLFVRGKFLPTLRCLCDAARRISCTELSTCICLNFSFQSSPFRRILLHVYPISPVSFNLWKMSRLNCNINC